MKKIAIAILVAVVAFQFASCGSKYTFDETHAFTGAWNRFKPIQFTVDVQQPGEDCDFHLAVAVDTARYRYSSLPVIFNIETDAGERRFFPATVLLQDKQGVWKGEWKDGLLVVDQRVRDCFSFNRKGTHSVKVGQATHYYDIEGIRSLRLYIVPTATDYPE